MRNKLKLISLLLSATSLMVGGCISSKDKETKPSENVPSEVIPSGEGEPSEPADTSTKVSFSEGISFFADAGVTVSIPEFSVASAEVVVETDDSYEGYFDYYITGATHEEMVAFKDSCVNGDWSVVSEYEGDFRLQFGETIAYADLLDYTEYVLVSFFTYEIPTYTTASAVDAVAELLSSMLGETISA